MKRALIIGLSMALAGCASHQSVDSSANKMQPLVFEQALDEKSDAQAAEEQLKEDFAAMLLYCEQELSGFDSKVDRQAKNAFWLSIVGLVAGAVAVPALTAANATLNATWISALGGLAGATNLAGQSLASSGLSGTAAARTRNTIVDLLMTQIAIIADSGKEMKERRSALMKANAACVVYRITEPTVLK